MTVRLYENNASNTLNGAITGSATTITLNDASSFPTPGAGEIAYATLDNQSGTVEVISYTGISTNDLTGVTRAQEGTSASAFSDGDLIEQRATALSFTDVLAADESPQLRGVLDASDSSVYYSFGGSSTATKYSLNHSGGLPRLYGNSNFYYGFTSSAIYIQAGTTFNRLEVTNDSNRFRFYTNNSERFQIDDNGVNVSNGDLAINTGSLAVGKTSATYALDVDAGTSSYIAFLRSDVSGSVAQVALLNEAAFSTTNFTAFEWRANSSTTQRTIVKMQANFSDTTDATRTSRLDFTAIDNGTGVTPLSLRGSNSWVNGISFDSGSNVLTEYEEGTWTVTPYDAASAGNASTTTVTGYYTRVGNIVSCWFGGLNNIDTTGMSSGNTIYFTLPIAVSSSHGATGNVVFDTVTYPTGTSQLNPYAAPSTSRIQIKASGTGVADSTVLVSDVTSTTTDILGLSFIYGV